MSRPANQRQDYPTFTLGQWLGALALARLRRSLYDPQADAGDAGAEWWPDEVWARVYYDLTSGQRWAVYETVFVGVKGIQAARDMDRAKLNLAFAHLSNIKRRGAGQELAEYLKKQAG